VDGAGWRGVYDILKKGSFAVSIVQNPKAVADLIEQAARGIK
jgi:hypothetical protein